jgi:predicted RNA-binding Zn ribbon-like protein
LVIRPQPTRTDEDPAHCPELGLVLAFLNTRASLDRPERYPERLDTQAHARAWIAADLRETEAAGVRRLSTDDVKTARALRGALVAALGDEDRGDGWQTVNDIAAAYPVRMQFSPGAVQLTPDKPSGLTALVLTSLAIAMRSTSWVRVRLCARETCRAAFYDSSKNATQRWHSYPTCGNRTNQAALRRRRTNDHGS